MTPHSSQTPRYNQGSTPTQHGQFLRPGAPVSRPPNYSRQSPFTGTSPRPRPQMSSGRDQSRRIDEDDWERSGNSWRGGTPRGDQARRIQSQEEEDWDRAEKSWVKGSTPRNDQARRIQSQEEEDWDRAEKAWGKGSTPRNDQTRRMQTQEEEDWDRAESAWESRNKGNTPRADSIGRSTPRG
jgi:hypothetical protein